MKLVLIGHGKMGKMLEQRAAELGHEVVAALDRESLAQLAALPAADMAVDFSRPETLGAIAAYVRRTGTPLLSGTTGYTPEEMEELRGLGSVAPVLHAANFSLGIAVFRRALAQVSDTLKPAFDIEIEEIHHNQKADAPSGTAKLLLSAIDPVGEYTPVYGRATPVREPQRKSEFTLCGAAPWRGPTRFPSLARTRSCPLPTGPPAA